MRYVWPSPPRQSDGAGGLRYRYDPARPEIEAQWERLKAFFETWFRSFEGHFKAAFNPYTSEDDFEAQLEILLRRRSQHRSPRPKDRSRTRRSPCDQNLAPR